MIAQRLKEKLPDFTYLKIAKKDEQWGKWLSQICAANEWYHIKSPLIWREIGLKQGKKDFIGDIDRFLDLCYEYYGISRDVLSAGSFNDSELNWFTKQTEAQFLENIKAEAKKRKTHRSRQVCITGASTPIAEIVIMEILQTQKQWREDGLEIRLFDDPTKEKKLISSAADAKFCPGPSGFGNCRVTTTLKDSLTNVDLVIVLDCLARKSKESLVKWLKRNRNAMCALGKALNAYAPPHCRVIIGSPSNQPICYNATVLASFATNLHVRNIVAVTQDLGREILRSISIKTNCPLRNFYCPPVWGFVGLNKIVDFSNTLQSHLYKVPGKRMKSTLPQGTEEMELRMNSIFTTEDDKKGINVWSKETGGDPSLQFGRWPYLAKATAILDLLNVWGLKQENGNGEIISLGVYSDGTFNIPKGLYWSQPVTLVNGFWVPFKNYPIPRSNHINAYYLFTYSIATLYRTKVQPRVWESKDSTRDEDAQKEIKKFDFDELIQEIGVPAIRTDKECVDYLKFLAKKEFGFDFDAVDDRISEESEEEKVITPVEEVAREEVFCECWRQQLKELQKVVFDQSSTTEVEIDLSDVISGSEWSIINPKKEISSVNPVAEVQKVEDENRKQSQDEYSGSTVCSCGAVESGSTCQCLGLTPKEPSQDKISTEHFYAEQNAEVFEVDTNDPIYADLYLNEKHVTFDAEAREGDLTGFQVKFYGRKDSVRDKKADLGMQKRIRRYERGGEESIGELGEEEMGTREESLVSEISEESQKDGKFHLSVRGASYEIIGDQDALEVLDERQKIADKEMEDSSFREIYKDEITPSIQLFPPDLAMSTASSSGKDISICGERNSLFASDNVRSLTSGTFGAPAEADDDEGMSLGSLEDDLNEIWRGEGGPGLFHIESEKSEDMPIARKKWWEREGVSLCCICRCIIPEGLPCCPCGATTVVEVFKKESVEIFIQSEDDFTYDIEYLERSVSESEKSAGNKVIKSIPPPRKNLPPESFFPFTPKPVNQFRPTQRPFKLTKDYLEYFRKDDFKISSKCQKLLDEAKTKLEEEEENAKRKEEEEGEREYELPEPCKGEEKIKTDFSDLNFLNPCSLEDWKLTVQKKYREWFFEGAQIRDESYYDIAIEEVSEDEFEFDKELERFFET